MKQSFALLAPPQRFKVHVQAKDSNGAEVDYWLREPTMPLLSQASAFGIEMVKRYIPFDQRVNIKPSKGDPNPVEFPQGPNTGPILLDEPSVFTLANLTFFQDPEGEQMPFAEFVYMFAVAPECYRASFMALQAVMQGQDLEGNPLGGSG
jgi:hypothetical protein